MNDMMDKNQVYRMIVGWASWLASIIASWEHSLGGIIILLILTILIIGKKEEK